MVVYLIFAVMILMGFRYVVLPKSTIRNPFDRKQSVTVTGIQHFVLFTFSTGIIMLTGLSAERLMVWLVLVIISLLIDKHEFVGGRNITVWFYILFLLWLLVSLAITPEKIYGFRVFLKYLFPLLFMLLAAKLTIVPIFYFRALKNIFQMAIVAALYLLILSRFLPLFWFLSDIVWNIAAIQDFMLIGVAIALMYHMLHNKKKYLLYVLAFFSCSIAWTNRTGLLASSITLALYFLIRYKIKALPYIILFAGLFLGIVLYVDGFREKMFKKEMSSEEVVGQRESLSTEDINSSGRFAMWEWSMALYFHEHEWTGSGLGVLQAKFYSLDHPFAPLQVVHNDYVQILCDTGLIGLILYAGILLSLVIHAFSTFWNAKKPMIVRGAGMLAGLTMGGMISTLYTDNVVNYSLLTLTYPFGLYGMFLGLNHHISSQVQRPVVRPINRQ